MNGCPYLLLTHGPEKRYKPKRGRRRHAMCFAGTEMQRCEQVVGMRGERCAIYRAKRGEEAHG